MAVAYRMLGSLTEADDAVPDAWPRLSGAGTAEIDILADPARLRQLDLAGLTTDGWAHSQHIVTKEETRWPR